MRILLYTVTLLLLVEAGVLLITEPLPWSQPPSQSPATVLLTPARHDFGPVRRGEVVTAKFEIKNGYPVPVVIGPISKGCSCSHAEVSAKTIPPGGSATLTVVWNLRGKRGSSSEAVSVTYRGPGGVAGYQAVHVAADVYGVVEPVDNVIRVGSKAPVAEVEFVSRVGRKFALVGATTNHPSLTATVLHDRRRVRVTFDPDVSGRESGRLRMVAVTDAVEDREIEVTIEISTD